MPHDTNPGIIVEPEVLQGLIAGEVYLWLKKRFEDHFAELAAGIGSTLDETVTLGKLKLAFLDELELAAQLLKEAVVKQEQKKKGGN